MSAQRDLEKAYLLFADTGDLPRAMLEKFWHIRRCPLFRALTDDELASLERASRFRRFTRGDVVYSSGDQSEGVMLLCKGRVKICGHGHEGKQLILGIIEPGELFGELAIVSDKARDEIAVAIEDSEICRFNTDVVRQYVNRHPKVSMEVTKLIGLRRLRIERRLASLLFRSSRECLVELLVELAETYGQPVDDGIRLRIKLTHQDIAHLIGSTRETVTLLLGALQSEGLLTTGRRKITILNLDKLADEAHRPFQSSVG